MSTTPAIVWQQILAVSGEDVDGVLWSNPQLEPGAPAGITLAAGQQLRCEVLTLGSTSVAYPFTVLVNAGSDDFQVTSGITPLKVGMLVAGSDALPVGLQILAVNEPAAGSVLLGGESVFVQPTTATLSANLTAIDEYPYGTLAAAVSPSAGVSVVDWGFDQTGNDGNVGNGTAMSNSGFQAIGLFGVTFPAAGTYEVAVSYMSYDTDYTDCSSTLSVQVT